VLELIYDEKILAITRRTRILLLAESILTLTNIILITIFILSGSIVSYRGFVSSGTISLINSRLVIGGSEAILTPLQSIETISVSVLIISIIVGVFSLIIFIEIVFSKRNNLIPKIYILLPYAIGLHIASILLFTILLSLLRVSLRDVLAYVPISYSTEVSVGRFYLYPSSTSFSWVYNIYMGHQLILWIYVLANLLLSITTLVYIMMYIIERVSSHIKNEDQRSEDEVIS